MSKCGRCYKEYSECKCDFDNLKGNSGWSNSARFGCEELSYEYVVLDERILLKLKMFNDYVYLDRGGIEWLNSITKEFVDIKKSVYEKQLLDWDCNRCGEKTNNGQEWCDNCIDDGVPFD